MAILAFFLYFTGWIYRWAYFAFFQLQVTTIDFSIESFFFVPLQVFFGDIQKTIINIIIIALIILVIWLIFSKTAIINRYYSRFSALVKDLILVSGILLILFWIARYQGTVDARRDAIDKTSLLPVVTFATPKNLIPLGRNPDDVSTIPSLQDYKLIGDVKNWENLQLRDTNDSYNPNDRLVWRLLLKNRAWIYLFPGLPANAPLDQRPPILAIAQTGNGDQLLILAPEPGKED